MKKELYNAPEVEVLEIVNENVLCQSNAGADDMTPGSGAWSDNNG